MLKVNAMLWRIIAVIHWLITFFTDRLVFKEGFVSFDGEKPANYAACKLLLLILLLVIWRTVFVLIRDLSASLKAGSLCAPGVSDAYRVAGYALIYLVPITGVLIFKLPEGFLSNDETLIFAEAASLNTYTWFYYLTTWYYIITMMLIPCWLGPVLFKVALQVIACGYCVFRFKRYLKSPAAYLIYLPFLLFPTLAYTTSAHRIPVYYLVYLLLLVKLSMDRLEGRATGGNGLFMLLFGAALITQWRTEGIYMAPLSVILLVIAYPDIIMENGRAAAKRAGLLILAALLVQYAVAIPQNGVIPARMDDKAINRMGPFWAYTITNMYRNGLDLEKNAADLEKVYKYLDRDVLRSINEDLGDINYEDTLILYYQGYTGVIEGGDYETYVEGCRSIFKNNLDVFMKTRWGAFKYAALPYSVTTDEGGVRGLLKLAFSAFKSLSYNLFIPTVLMVILWAVMLIKKKWLCFFMLSGLICHWSIVFILAPASYFKYYLPVYMNIYFMLAALAAIYAARRGIAEN